MLTSFHSSSLPINFTSGISVFPFRSRIKSGYGLVGGLFENSGRIFGWVKTLVYLKFLDLTIRIKCGRRIILFWLLSPLKKSYGATIQTESRVKNQYVLLSNRSFCLFYYISAFCCLRKCMLWSKTGYNHEIWGVILAYWTPIFERQFESVMLMYELTKKQSVWTKTKSSF